MAKSNNTGLIVLLVGGAAAYYAYTQGWLSWLFFSTVSGTGTEPPPAPRAVAPSSSAVSAVAAVATPAPVFSPYGPVPVTNPNPSSIAIPAGSPAATMVANCVKGGGTQATCTAQVQSIMASGAVPGVSGLGRTVVYFPRLGKAIVLPRNYHFRGVA